MGGRVRSLAGVVDDMSTTLAFYRLLGLDIPSHADEEDHVLHDLGNGVRLSWNTLEVEHAFNPGYRPPVGTGRMGLVFEYDSVEEMEATYRAVRAAGHVCPLPPFDAPWGNRHCRVLDPDGNAVDLFADPSRATRT